MAADNQFRDSDPVIDRTLFYYDEQGNAMGSAENFILDDWNDSPPNPNGEGREGQEIQLPSYEQVQAQKRELEYVEAIKEAQKRGYIEM